MPRQQPTPRPESRALALAAMQGPYRASQRDVALASVFVVCAFVLSALLGPMIMY